MFQACTGLLDSHLPPSSREMVGALGSAFAAALGSGYIPPGGATTALPLGPSSAPSLTYSTSGNPVLCFCISPLVFEWLLMKLSKHLEMPGTFRVSTCTALLLLVQTCMLHLRCRCICFWYSIAFGSWRLVVTISNLTPRVYYLQVRHPQKSWGHMPSVLGVFCPMKILCHACFLLPSSMKGWDDAYISQLRAEAQRHCCRWLTQDELQDMDKPTGREAMDPQEEEREIKLAS